MSVTSMDLRRYLLTRHDNALPILDPLDRQFLELDRVCLLRYVLPCFPKVTRFYVTLGRRNFGGSSPTPIFRGIMIN